MFHRMRQKRSMDLNMPKFFDSMPADIDVADITAIFFTQKS